MPYIHYCKGTGCLKSASDVDSIMQFIADRIVLWTMYCCGLYCGGFMYVLLCSHRTQYILQLIKRMETLLHCE